MEAAVIFPAAILMVIILLYLSIILFQKANLHAGLETALTYYKSTVTDMYVSAQKLLSMKQKMEQHPLMEIYTMQLPRLIPMRNYSAMSTN